MMMFQRLIVFFSMTYFSFIGDLYASSRGNPPIFHHHGLGDDFMFSPAHLKSHSDEIIIATILLSVVVILLEYSYRVFSGKAINTKQLNVIVSIVFVGVSLFSLNRFDAEVVVWWAVSTFVVYAVFWKKIRKNANKATSMVGAAAKSTGKLASFVKDEYNSKSSSSRPHDSEDTSDSVILNSDESFFEKAMDEVESGNVIKGLWAKAYTMSDGDKEKQKVIYIKMRVSQLDEGGHDMNKMHWSED